MALTDFQDQSQSVRLLQRSLERGRLGHAYLFTGQDTRELEAIARALAKTLNCRQPVQGAGGTAIDCCDRCISCQKIERGNHADVHWIRPESKSRLILIEQLRDLMREIYLKPTEAEHKFGIIVDADRMNASASNAFLKTLEEPPAKSVLILVSTQPQRLLETIHSRCLRLSFAGRSSWHFSDETLSCLGDFGRSVATPQKSLLGRYRLLDVIGGRLAQVREQVEQEQKSRSPLDQYQDVDKALKDKWEDELTAAVESEYRRRRSELLLALQWWFRDVWLKSLGGANELLCFADLQETGTLAGRLDARECQENLQVLEQMQRVLHTNVQESLALEVGMLKLKL